MLRRIDRWCKQVTDITTTFWENISTTRMGDIAQLPLISDSLLYNPRPFSDITIQ